MPELVLYTNPMSRGRMARWMLEEIGEPYETNALNYGDEMRGDAYRAVNPMMKVPAVTYGDTLVTEVPAICVWLAETFPKAGLAPKPDERANFFRWLFFMAGPFEQATVNKSFGFEVPSDGEQRAGYGSMDRVLNVLENWLSNHDYVCGTRFTAADVYVGGHIGFALQFGAIPDREAYKSYFDRLKSRAALQQANELDDKLAAEMQG